MPGLPDNLVDLLVERAYRCAGDRGGVHDPVARLLETAGGDWPATQLARSRLLRRLAEAPGDGRTEAAAALLGACLERMASRSPRAAAGPTAFVHVPPREGRAARVEAGRRFHVIDLEGGQVADLFAYSADDVSEYHSAEHTRVHVSRLFPRPGECFVTNRRRPILRLEADNSPGVHDMLCAACDPTRYAALGHTGWHASCAENLRRSMADLGYPEVHVPQPINLFMNTPVSPGDGSIGWRPTLTKPGDHITFRAEIDAVIAVSACPQDVVCINSGAPSALGIAIEPS